MRKLLMTREIGNTAGNEISIKNQQTSNMQTKIKQWKRTPLFTIAKKKKRKIKCLLKNLISKTDVRKTIKCMSARPKSTLKP